MELIKPKARMPRTLSGEERVNSLIDVALASLEEGKIERAIDTLIEAKRIGPLARDLNHIRAICFVEKESYLEAKEALVEELKYFPDNAGALALLETIRDKVPTKNATTQIQILGNQDFQEVITGVRVLTIVEEMNSREWQPVSVVTPKRV